MKLKKFVSDFQIEKEKMLPITKKRVRLSMDEKLWIINHRKENPKIQQNKIALDFSAKLKKQSAELVS